MVKEYRQIYGDAIADIILFGSYARGNNNDFFIAAKEDAVEQFDRAVEMFEAIESFLA